jgi:AraC family transcriptional regulator, ethanolamine operon transcriptional activator
MIDCAPTFSVRDSLRGRRRAIELSDASEQAATQNWLPLEINQISAGNYQGHMRVAEHADVSVYFENQNCTVHKRGVMDDKFCTVSFFRSQLPQTRFSEFSPTDNSLFFLPCGTEFDIYVPGNTKTVYFRIDQSKLLHKARAMNPGRWENLPAGLQILDLLDRRFLDIFTDDIYASVAPTGGAGAQGLHGPLEDMMMEQVLLAMSSSSSGSADAFPELSIRRRAREVVNQVVEYVGERFTQNICPTISDICQDLKVSERTLQYGFKKILNLSPNTYLRYRRLNQVRMQLLRPANADVTVTDIAMHWHFWHLGRFSSDYLKLFSELPSTTLRRVPD